MNRLLMTTACVTALVLGGCNATMLSKQNAGTLLGAVGGGFSGSQVGTGRGQLVAVGLGTLVGAAVGGNIGASLDKIDRIYAERSAQYALETQQIGTASTWINPNTGYSGGTTPLNTFTNNRNQYCREYNTWITVGGRTQSAYGMACRQPDGSWELIT